ncbi:hypothetical protein GTP91_25995 [Rugamonas sp. FT82W]|uniref:Uncharacterized protein n=1 Tax=Duganella vulcania TaxID=2692166 RepID=A0A845GAY5_9BURK|nr:hypothetical protein [Duganella vulcania]
MRQAEDHLRIANESAQIAAKSTVLETRLSRLDVANDHLAQLKSLAANYPRITITRLAQFELDIKKIEAEVREQAMLHPSQRDGLHDGWVYCAQLRFQTPLEFLRQHGNEQNDKTLCPDDLPCEYGSWLPKLKSFRAMGIEIDEPPHFMASPVGPIPRDGGDYLKFLIAIRTAAEAEGTIQQRRDAIEAQVARPQWAQFTAHPGHYVDQICDYFFPTFLSTVTALPRKTVTAMAEVAMDTPERIELASDEQLLKFKGIGPALLLKLRTRCAEITTHRNEPWLDLVHR